MAYPNYNFPATYQPMMYPQPMYQAQSQPQPQTVQQSFQPPVQAPQNNSAITWVQGEAGAKAYPLAPGTNILLMDSESECFYIKSTDASGMPMPLRTFEYKEVFPVNETIDARHSHTSDAVDMSMFATKDEIRELKHMLESMSAQMQPRKPEGKSNGK